MKYKLVGLGILFLLCWMACCPQTSRGAVIWADDFNDGNYDGWTICDNDALAALFPGIGFNGSQWSATNNYLQLEPDVWGIITHPSTIAYGTWSFDFKFNETSVGQTAEIGIIATDHYHTALTAGDWDSPERTIIVIRFSQLTANDFALSLHKRYDGNATTIDSENIPAAEWHHIVVTRTTEGELAVYHNCLPIMEGVDTDIVTSELFSLWFETGQMIDNVVVDDEVLIPTCGIIIDPVLIVVVVVVVIVVVIILAYFLRRRR